MTPLRAAYLRARDLEFEQQLDDCVDRLQEPELFAAMLADSHAQMARFHGSGAGAVDEEAAWADPGTSVQRPNELFYASREVFVVLDSSSFTCLADAYRPLEPGLADEEAASDGFDYLGMTCTSRPRPVLGAAQADVKTTCYTLLLRMLANLCDIAHESQLVPLDRSCFSGGLGPMPSFDLHLVLWEQCDDDGGPPPERTPISQLSRDLAEFAKASLLQTPQFLPILSDIVCLNMRPERFDGRVRFDWRV
jgi:hypothetical protein